MTRTPDVLLRTPERVRPLMDALSDVLRLVRLKGGVFLHAAFTAPWCILSQVGREDCGSLLEGAEHLVLYHYVVEGRLTAQIPNGKVVIFPHNHQHLLGSRLDLPPVPSKQIVGVSPEGGLLVIRHGGGGERTRIVCGFLGCDRWRAIPSPVPCHRCCASTPDREAPPPG